MFGWYKRWRKNRDDLVITRAVLAGMVLEPFVSSYFVSSYDAKYNLYYQWKATATLDILFLGESKRMAVTLYGKTAAEVARKYLVHLERERILA